MSVPFFRRRRRQYFSSTFLNIRFALRIEGLIDTFLNLFS